MPDEERPDNERLLLALTGFIQPSMVGEAKELMDEVRAELEEAEQMREALREIAVADEGTPVTELNDIAERGLGAK